MAIYSRIQKQDFLPKGKHIILQHIALKVYLHASKTLMKKIDISESLYFFYC